MQNSGCCFRGYPIKICSHEFIMFLDPMLSGISKALLIQFWVPEQILLNKDNLTERLLEDES